MATKTLEPKQTNYWELKKHFEKTENEGLVFYGCGGDLKNWVNGIGEVLLEENEANGEDDFQKRQEIKQQKNQNNGVNKKGAGSSSNNSFDLLNYEIQNKIKEA